MKNVKLIIINIKGNRTQEISKIDIKLVMSSVECEKCNMITLKTVDSKMQHMCPTFFERRKKKDEQVTLAKM